MRIQTNLHFLRESLGDTFDQIWGEYQKSEISKVSNHEEASFFWMVREAPSVPKSWQQSLKTNKKGYLATGFANHHLKASLLIRQEKGKNWESPPVGKINGVPAEILRHLIQIKSKWTGAVVEIFTPLHQWHPGMTEHALIGSIFNDEKRFFLLSDRPDPMAAPSWNLFELNAKASAAIPIMTVFDRFAQKIFKSARDGDEIMWGGSEFKREAADKAVAHLNGVSSFLWTPDPSITPRPAPFGAMKFPLGCGFSEVERRLIPTASIMADLMSFK